MAFSKRQKEWNEIIYCNIWLSAFKLEQEQFIFEINPIKNAKHKLNLKARVVSVLRSGQIYACEDIFKFCILKLRNPHMWFAQMNFMWHSDKSFSVQKHHLLTLIVTRCRSIYLYKRYIILNYIYLYLMHQLSLNSQ